MQLEYGFWDASNMQMMAFNPSPVEEFLDRLVNVLDK